MTAQMSTSHLVCMSCTHVVKSDHKYEAYPMVMHAFSTVFMQTHIHVCTSHMLESKFELILVMQKKWKYIVTEHEKVESVIAKTINVYRMHE